MGLNARNADIASGSIMYKGEDLLKKSDKDMEAIRGQDIAEIFQDSMTSLDPTMKIGRQLLNPHGAQGDEERQGLGASFGNDEVSRDYRRWKSD